MFEVIVSFGTKYTIVKQHMVLEANFENETIVCKKIGACVVKKVGGGELVINGEIPLCFWGVRCKKQTLNRG